MSRSLLGGLKVIDFSNGLSGAPATARVQSPCTAAMMAARTIGRMESAKARGVG